jgi:hypothetical protein
MLTLYSCRELLGVADHGCDEFKALDRSERHPDAAALLPDHQAALFDAAMVEDELLRNDVAAVHVEAGAAGAEIDDVADDRGTFQIGKKGSGF